MWPLNVAVGVNDRMWLALHSDGSWWLIVSPETRWVLLFRQRVLRPTARWFPSSCVLYERWSSLFFHYTTMVLIETFLSQGTVYLLNKIDVIASKCTSNQVRTDVIPFILKHIKSESYKIQVIVASFLQ